MQTYKTMISAMDGFIPNIYSAEDKMNWIYTAARREREFSEFIPLPESSNLDIPLNLDDEYCEAVIYASLELMSKSGNSPDVALANNFHVDYAERLRALKRDKQFQKAVHSERSYKDWR